MIATKNTFLTKLADMNSNVCIGIDPDSSLMPDNEHNGKPWKKTEAFCLDVIGKTLPHAGAYKFNLAFFEALPEGDMLLRGVISELKRLHPKVPLIGDSKNADIGNTNTFYFEKMFGKYDFDAMTTNPYMGEPESVFELLKKNSKFMIPVLLTSNANAEKVQMLRLQNGLYLYQEIGKQIREDWQISPYCGAVIGATKSQQHFQNACEVTRDSFVLVPGVGAQGGDLEMCIRTLKDRPFLINSSRGIIYAPDPAAEAQKLKEEINTLKEKYVIQMT